jgi:DnaJ-class molecular chaperone
MSIIEVCPECGTALGIKEEDLTITYKSNEKRIWKDCSYCEGRGYLSEVVGYTTGGEQRLSYTCTACGGSGYEETDMVIRG